MASEDTDSKPSSPVSAKASKPQFEAANPVEAQLPIEISRAVENEAPKFGAPVEVKNPF